MVLQGQNETLSIQEQTYLIRGVTYAQHTVL